MNSILDEITAVHNSYSNSPIRNIDKLPQSGSDRIYFRVYSDDGSCIATYGPNVTENKTFINFSRHFLKSSCPVPKIYAVNGDHTIYLQEDFGDDSLLTHL